MPFFDGYCNIDYAKVGMNALIGGVPELVTRAAFDGIVRGIRLLGKTK